MLSKMQLACNFFKFLVIDLINKCLNKSLQVWMPRSLGFGRSQVLKFAEALESASYFW